MTTEGLRPWDGDAAARDDSGAGSIPAVEGAPMWIRLTGMTLGGKLSLGHLLLTSSLLLFGAGSDLAHWCLVVLGFPLMYAPWAYQQAFGGSAEPVFHSGGTAALFFLLLVANAYLWGHLAAGVVRLAFRRSRPAARLAEHDDETRVREPNTR